MQIDEGRCVDCGLRTRLVRTNLSDEPDDWKMLCEECTHVDWFIDPMSITLMEVVDWFGANPSDQNRLESMPSDIAYELLEFSFSRMHAVEAGKLVSTIGRGIDAGETQGTYHPHFQDEVRASIIKDPEDRFE